LTKEYDGSNVTADLKAGMLEVTIPKNPQRPGERVVLGAPRPTPCGNESNTSKSPPQTAARKETGANPGETKYKWIVVLAG
jgi:hypothetical protein